MGRKRNIYIREYFIENGEESKCKTCNKVVNSGSISNLKRHLQSAHPDVFTEYESKCQTKKCVVDDGNKPIKFLVEMTRNEVRDACVDIITTDARPLQILDSKGFKTLTNQIFNGLSMEPISSRNIMNSINEKFVLLKRRISNNCKGKILSLKLDTATRHCRSILGVNAQLIVDKEIVIYTLAMVELKIKHTAQNLQHEIENILKNYCISMKQIYSITTDNARNLLKCVDLLSQNGNDESEDDEEALTRAQLLTDGIAYENVVSIKCAAHTLQLAVKDFLATQSQSLIVKARNLVKLLRSVLYR